jgi:hypothetical protein
MTQNLDRFIRYLNFKSEIGQDRAVLEFLGPKYNGTFVDIGCAKPISISNTFLFEATFNWRGIAIDIENAVDNGGETWKSHRPQSVHLITDALTIDYSSLFKQHKLPVTIDYLSLDLEPPDLSLECLMKLPLKEYIFNIITFEVDEYREGGIERSRISREYLKELGYNYIGCINRQDDVYIHSSYKKPE